MSELDVPVVDISDFSTGDAAARARVTREVAGAVEGIGFLTIVGHGVPEKSMRDVSAVYRSFFDLPLDIKLKYVNRARNTNRGYVPFGEEFVASSHDAVAKLVLAPGAPAAQPANYRYQVRLCANVCPLRHTP